MPKIAAIQMSSSQYIPENLQTAATLVQEAANKGCDLCVLPEMFATLGLPEDQKESAKEKLGNGPIQDFLAELARKNKIWIVGGTIPLAIENSRKVYAGCLVYNEQGKRVGHYNKIHLFDAHVQRGSEIYQESKSTAPGDKIVVVDTPFGKLGIVVCYDIRFPELFYAMHLKKVELIAVPCAFTVKTGEAHWEILMRSQAIQNFSYIIAAAQWGTHPNGRLTYGHSMIVEPWGHVIAELADGVGVITADIDLNYLHQIREDFPVLQHKLAQFK